MKEKLSNGELCDSVVVSYKCIAINTYNVFVIDLKTKLIKYRHEGFQLWESPTQGFLLETNEFMILSKHGIEVISLGEKPERDIRDNEGQLRKLHSVGQPNYLKIEPTNHLLYSFQFYDNRTI